MRTSLVNKQIGPLTAFDASGKESILKTLAYFDIFHYPLTKEEIAKFMDLPADNRKIGEWLSELLDAGEIFFYHDLYSLQDNPLLVHRRNKGQQRAALLLKKARKI